jgi:hypothetical protein
MSDTHRILFGPLTAKRDPLPPSEDTDQLP